ncbi:MAG: hypothetical protein V4805_12215 [Pseudomonadota bacterium]
MKHFSINVIFKQATLALLITSACVMTPAFAASKSCPSCGASEASQDLSMISAVVVGGTLSMVVASGIVVVESVESVADGVVVVLKGASEATTASIKLTGKAAKGLSVAAGTVVDVTVMATGSMLTAAGKAVAYIPNEVGAALMHHSKVKFK